MTRTGAWYQEQMDRGLIFSIQMLVSDLAACERERDDLLDHYEHIRGIRSFVPGVLGLIIARIEARRAAEGRKG